MKAGHSLPALEKEITQEGIQRYAEASGDFNPIHLDAAHAAATLPFGGTIAHGMLLLAYVSEVMTRAFGEAWVGSGRLRVQFRGAARPGDRVTVQGRVHSAEETTDGHRVACKLEGRNQQGQLLISGEAWVTPGRAGPHGADTGHGGG